MGKKIIRPEAVPLMAVVDKHSPLAEQCRIIRSNIEFSAVDREIKTIAITSSGVSEGKSTAAANLAVVCAEDGKKVLLVDADLRRSTVHLTFKVRNDRGLSTLLSSKTKTIAENLCETPIKNLSVLPAGPKPPNPSEMLGSRKMSDILQQLRSQYDVVIFDLPPLGFITDTQLLASKVDGTLLVVGENVTKKEALRKSRDLLVLSKANVIGVLYNKERDSENAYYY